MRFPLVGIRLELRPFELSDAAAAHRIYANERVMRWVGNGVRAAFEKLGLPELVALIRPENRASAAVATKLGFEPGARVSAYGSDHLLYRLRALEAPAAGPSSGGSGRR